VAYWDRSRIEQVVVNLLSNALKYAPGKPVRIGAEMGKNRVVLKVQYHGPGIAQENQCKIFDRFERAPSTRNIGGRGLGLYIVKQIVLGHAGDIRVESEEGAGTTFIVTLPICPPVELENHWQENSG